MLKKKVPNSCFLHSQSLKLRLQLIIIELILNQSKSILTFPNLEIFNFSLVSVFLWVLWISWIKDNKFLKAFLEKTLIGSTSLYVLVHGKDVWPDQLPSYKPIIKLISTISKFASINYNLTLFTFWDYQCFVGIDI